MGMSVFIRTQGSQVGGRLVRLDGGTFWKLGFHNKLNPKGESLLKGGRVVPPNEMNSFNHCTFSQSLFWQPKLCFLVGIHKLLGFFFSVTELSLQVFFMLLAQIPCPSWLTVMGPLPGTALCLWALGWDQLSPPGRGTAVLIFAKKYILLGSFSLKVKAYGLCKALAR